MVSEKEDTVKVTVNIPSRFWPERAKHGERTARIVHLLKLGEAAEKAAIAPPAPRPRHVRPAGDTQPAETGRADLPPREDGLAWGAKRLHRLKDDPLGLEELKMLMALDPRPTFKEMGRLLGYSRDVISGRVKEIEEAEHGRE